MRLPMPPATAIASSRLDPRRRRAVPQPRVPRCCSWTTTRTPRCCSARRCERSATTCEVAFDAPASAGAGDRYVPDVALLDLGLPVIDGYELAQRLRARDGWQGVRFRCSNRLRAATRPRPIAGGRVRRASREADRPWRCRRHDTPPGSADRRRERRVKVCVGWVTAPGEVHRPVRGMRPHSPRARRRPAAAPPSE